MLTDLQMFAVIGTYLFIVSFVTSSLVLTTQYAVIENSLPKITDSTVTNQTMCINKSYTPIYGTWDSSDCEAGLHATSLEHYCIFTGGSITLGGARDCDSFAQVAIGDINNDNGVFTYIWNITDYSYSDGEKNYFGIGNIETIVTHGVTTNNTASLNGLIKISGSSLTLFSQTVSYFWFIPYETITEQTVTINPSSNYNLKYIWNAETGTIQIWYNNVVAINGQADNWKFPWEETLFGPNKVQALFYTNRLTTHIKSVQSKFTEIKDTSFGIWNFIPTMIKVATYQLPPNANPDISFESTYTTNEKILPFELWILFFGIPELLLGFMIVRLIRGVGTT